MIGAAFRRYGLRPAIGCSRCEIEILYHLLLSLEAKLKRRGANYFGKANREANAVEDGALMTGQSPASAPPLAKTLKQRLLA